MKNKLISYISIALKFITLVSGLSAYQGLIPSKYLPIALIAFAAISSTKDYLIHLQTDFSGDVKMNMPEKMTLPDEVK